VQEEGSKEKEGAGVGVSVLTTWARPVRPAGEGLWCTQANHFLTKLVKAVFFKTHSLHHQ